MLYWTCLIAYLYVLKKFRANRIINSVYCYTLKCSLDSIAIASFWRVFYFPQMFNLIFSGAYRNRTDDLYTASVAL